MDEHVHNFNSCARLSTLSRLNLKKTHTSLVSSTVHRARAVESRFFLIENRSVTDARRLQMDEHVHNFNSCARLFTLSRLNLKKTHTSLVSSTVHRARAVESRFFLIENRSVIDARRLQMDEHVHNFNSCARLFALSRQNLKRLTRL